MRSITASGNETDWNPGAGTTYCSTTVHIKLLLVHRSRVEPSPFVFIWGPPVAVHLPAPGFKSLDLKEDVIERLDDFIEKHGWGYSGRPNVVTVALREYIERHERDAHLAKAEVIAILLLTTLPEEAIRRAVAASAKGDKGEALRILRDALSALLDVHDAARELKRARKA